MYLTNGTLLASSNIEIKFLKGATVKELLNDVVTDKEATQADSLFYQGELLYKNDDLVKALVYYKASERLARTNSHHDTVITSLLKQTSIYMKMQDLQKSEEKAREGIAYARLLKRHETELEFLLLYARSLQSGSKLEEAITCIFEGIELSAKAGTLDKEADFVIELAEVSLKRNNHKMALAQATSGLRRAILFNDTKRMPILANLLDRIVATAKKDMETSLTLAIKKLPPLRAQLA
jgi:tetratricopeptide (TPR) repeat protein